MNTRIFFVVHKENCKAFLVSNTHLKTTDEAPKVSVRGQEWHEVKSLDGGTAEILHCSRDILLCVDVNFEIRATSIVFAHNYWIKTK